ncbi:MAG: class I adenylate-forming enzyme family protein [Pseudomonadales bacterium]
MITSSQDRIAKLTAAGSWGVETLHSLLAQHASNQPQRLAVKDQPNREELTGDTPQCLSWLELHQASDNLARQLQQEGIGEDDRIIIQLPNVSELLVLYYAISKLGAIASPVPVQYGRHELQHVGAELEATALVTIGRFKDTELARESRAALPHLKVLSFGEDLQLDSKPGEPFACSAAANDANRVLTICWTSGTTGTPKGVPRSHNMWLATGICTAGAGNYAPEDRLLCPFPMVNMSAIGGFVFPAAHIGCSIVLHHPLDPPLFLQQIQDEKINFTITPPALLNQLAKAPEMWNQFDFSALRRVGSGSAPLSPGMIRTFGEDYGIEIVNIFGSNEGIALYSSPEEAPDPEVRATMFARPPEDVLAIKVADPETGIETVTVGDRGELLVSGPTVIDGYYNHSNQDVFSEAGYFRTGDLVEICGDNADFYKIVGRCKDIINRGGMKISPVELDIALEAHPDIAESAVCAYPDERLGEKICAYVVMQPGVELLSMEALQSYLLGLGLAKFKLPERIEAIDALPRNALGKVQRFLLQEQIGKKIEVES